MRGSKLSGDLAELHGQCVGELRVVDVERQGQQLAPRSLLRILLQCFEQRRICVRIVEWLTGCVDVTSCCYRWYPRTL